jgi:hypothetical protein
MAVVSAVTRASIFGQPGQVERVQVVTPWGLPTLCHALIAPLFLAACAEAAVRSGWNPLRIDSYNPRPIRGEDGSTLSEWSLHAWCLAWDFFATPPGVDPPGGVWTPDNGVTEEFAECFERYGFRWGGRWTDRPDVPHIEWAGGRPPEVQPPQEGDDMTPEQAATLDRIDWMISQIKPNADRLPDVHRIVDLLAWGVLDPGQGLRAMVAGITGGDIDDLDEAEVARLVLAGLSPEAIAAAIPEGVKDAVKAALREGVG